MTLVIPPREVPLGGLRAMTVRRTLPTRGRSLIGAWCFLDHYGPDDVAKTGGMEVPRHPHTGLATVSWLFTGSVDHIDSAGNAALVKPGELNLMTAGRGITHSEFSTSDTTVLHGVQLWYAMRDADRHVPPHFDHYAPEVIPVEGGEALVFLGALLGQTSPVQTPTEMVGAELRLAPRTRLRITVDPGHEHGLLPDQGRVTFNGQPLAVWELGFEDVGSSELVIEVGDEPARLILIGGEPFGEQIVMWWNFIGRSHEEIQTFRDQYQHEITTGEVGIFGPFPDGTPAPIPAPELPNARLRLRG